MGIEVFPGTAYYVPCTSSTRPASPVEGVMIRESDTDRVYIHDGSAWIYQFGGLPLYSARAYRNAALNIAAAVSTTLIAMDVESWDRNNNFDTSTGRYTVPVTGDYQVHGNIYFNLNNNPEQVEVGIYVNAAARSIGNGIVMRGGTAGDDWSLSVSDIVTVTAGDLIDLRANHNLGGNTCALNVAASARNYISICKMP